MHASKGRKYYACTEKRSQKRREIMVTITRRDLCRLALLSLMVAFDGRSYMALGTSSAPPPLFSEVLSQDNSLFLPLSCIIVYELLISCFYFLSHRWHVGPSLGSGSSELPNFIECIACLLCVDTNHVDLVYSSISQFSGSLCRSSVNSPTPYST